MLTPLCPYLYNMLTQLYGEVRIANEGESMLTTNIVDRNTGRRRLEVLVSGEYYRVSCPFCHETRHRLWINHRFGQPHPETGRRMTFLATCYNSQCLQNHANRTELERLIFGFRNFNERAAALIRPGRMPEARMETVPWPGQVIPVMELPVGHPLLQYFEGQRGFSRELLASYQVAYCSQGDPGFRLAEGRAVIPIVMQGRMVGWQCRYLGELDWRQSGIPKYYGLPGMSKRLMLYNYDLAKTMPFVVVVEGMSDVWRVGYPAVALLGRTLSSRQRLLLQQEWAGKPIILLLDSDAREQNEGIFRDLVGSGRNPIVDVQIPDGSDPGNLSYEENWGLIYARASQLGISLPAAAT